MIKRLFLALSFFPVLPVLGSGSSASASASASASMSDLDGRPGEKEAAAEAKRASDAKYAAASASAGAYASMALMAHPGLPAMPASAPFSGQGRARTLAAGIMERVFSELGLPLDRSSNVYADACYPDDNMLFGMAMRYRDLRKINIDACDISEDERESMRFNITYGGPTMTKMCVVIALYVLKSVISRRPFLLIWKIWSDLLRRHRIKMLITK